MKNVEIERTQTESNGTGETISVMQRAKAAEWVEMQRCFFKTGKTLGESYRKKMLQKLYQSICAYEKRLCKALQEDLGKPVYESYGLEIAMVKEEIRFALSHLHHWMKPRQVPTHLVNFPAKSFIHKEPLGVVLILSPWNYPVYLALCPLVSAIAAGNCAILKPSRSAKETAAVLEAMIAEYFQPEYIRLVRGGENINEALLSSSFDHIFFTGSPEVGKKVMQAAAKHLTPVTLELGGKSPCIVDETARIDLAARRIVWGKCINAGQTCVAPDYVLVHKDVKEKLIGALKRYITAFYGEKPLESNDLPHIINERHFYRLMGLMRGERLLFGGDFDREMRKIAPTILDESKPDSPVMQEEIFGPVLPILSYDRFDDALEFVRQREKPLALYLFTEEQQRIKKVLKEVPFGGGCINDTVSHLAGSHLPFGGVGQSGMGAYHGKKGFDTFTHEKGIVHKSTRIDIPLRYPPYHERKQRLLRMFF